MGAGATAVVFGLVVEVISTDARLAKLHSFSNLFFDHITVLSPILGGVLLLLIISWIGRRSTERQTVIASAFRLYTTTEKLSLDDFSFRDAQPQDPWLEERQVDQRPFFRTYFERRAVDYSDDSESDDDMRQEFSETDMVALVDSGRSFIILDQQYAGKTLTLFQIFKRLSGYTIVIPRNSPAVYEESTVALFKGKKVVVFLDDLATYAKENFDIQLFINRLKKSTNGGYRVIGTCREPRDFTVILTGQGNHITNFCESLQKLRLIPLTITERISLAETTGMPLDAATARQYPQPGNITMRGMTRVMQDQFKSMAESPRSTLQALKLLDHFWIRPSFARVETVLNHVFHRSTERDAIEKDLRYLWDEFFLLEPPHGQTISPHPGYLTYVVSFQDGDEPNAQYRDGLTNALGTVGDSDGLIHLANNLAHRMDLAAAIQNLDIALAIDPDNANAHYHRGYCLARSREFEEALIANSQALSISPDFAKAHNNRCFILNQLGRFEEALESIGQAITLRPDYEDARTNRAITLAHQGYFNEALEEFEKSLDISADNSYALLNMGITLSRQNKFELAIAFYDRALRARPAYAEVLLNKGITLARMFEQESALEQYEMAIQIKPDLARAHYQRGHSLASLQRFLEALGSYDQAINIDPSGAATHHYRGVALSFLNDYELAVAAYDLALELPPDKPDTHFQRGGSLGSDRKFPEAIAAFSRAIYLKPGEPDFHNQHGRALAADKQYQSAVAAYDLAIELRPDNPDSHFQRGWSLVSDRKFPEAIAAFSRAIYLKPGEPDFHYQLGRALAAIWQHSEAILAYDRVIGLEPEHARALFGKAYSLCRLAIYESKSR